MLVVAVVAVVVDTALVDRVAAATAIYVARLHTRHPAKPIEVAVVAVMAVALAAHQADPESLFLDTLSN
jgi:hypothetical protein